MSACVPYPHPVRHDLRKITAHELLNHCARVSVTCGLEHPPSIPVVWTDEDGAEFLISVQFLDAHHEPRRLLT